MSSRRADNSHQVDLAEYHVDAEQIDIVPRQLVRNADHAVGLAREAIRRDARLIVLLEVDDIDGITGR